jgi:hypothetical protein
MRACTVRRDAVQLDLDRRREGVIGGGEGGEDAIAGPLDDMALVGSHEAAQQAFVADDGGPRFAGIVLPHPGRSLEIGEQECDGARRKPRRVARGLRRVAAFRFA